MNTVSMFDATPVLVSRFAHFLERHEVANRRKVGSVSGVVLETAGGPCDQLALRRVNPEVTAVIAHHARRERTFEGGGFKLLVPGPGIAPRFERLGVRRYHGVPHMARRPAV